MAIFQSLMRGLEFLWALLVLAIVGNMIASANGHDPAVVNYTMFCAVFAMLSLLYLIPAAITDSFVIHPALPIALDALNTLFWFCAAVALAAELGVHSCSSRPYIRHNKITNGSMDMAGRCREAQASTAFLWFGFAAFAVSTVLSATSSSGGSLRGGIRRGPAMSQV